MSPLTTLAAVVALLGSAALFLADALVYLGGTFLVTGLGNVPLNNRLAAVARTDPQAVQVWEHYLRRWTWLNTVRTMASLVAALLFTLGLVPGGGS